MTSSQVLVISIIILSTFPYPVSLLSETENINFHHHHRRNHHSDHHHDQRLVEESDRKEHKANTALSARRVALKRLSEVSIFAFYLAVDFVVVVFVVVVIVIVIVIDIVIVIVTTCRVGILRWQ